MTPKRPLTESFINLEGKIVAAAYSTIVDLFYFFNGKGLLQIYGYFIIFIQPKYYKEDTKE